MTSLGLAACGDNTGSSETTGETTTQDSSGADSSSGGNSSTGAPTTGGSESSGGSESVGGSSSTGEVVSTGDDSSSGSTGDASSSGSTGGAESSSGSSGGDSSSSEGGETGDFTCEAPPSELAHKYVCFPKPVGLATCEECDDACATQAAQTELTGDPFCFFVPFELRCGPDPMPANAGECCWFVGVGEAQACEGRPFLVEGVARVSAATGRDDWSASSLPRLGGLGGATRAALAAAWLADAAAEHASVAAFARFTLQLLAVGAPAELIAGAQRATADEIEHAKLCYALAGAYMGASTGPGPLDMSGALEQTGLAAIAAATVVEGCIGETLAALAAEAAAERASDPAVRAALRQIAGDEARHAQLAWRFVQWALARGDRSVREAVAGAFAEGLRAPPAGAGWPAELDSLAMRAHGRLDPAEQASLFAAALRGSIAPAAQALLDQGLARAA